MPVPVYPTVVFVDELSALSAIPLQPLPINANEQYCPPVASGGSLTVPTYPGIAFPHELPLVTQLQNNDLLFLEQPNGDGTYSTYSVEVSSISAIGQSGWSGYSGESGYSGYTGSSGYSGYSGVPAVGIIYYPTSSSADVAGYGYFSQFPEAGTETSYSIPIVAYTNPALVGSIITQSGDPGEANITPSTWLFDAYYSLSGANTGSGGGGGAWQYTTGGSGGSGCVIISSSSTPTSTTGSPTLYTYGTSKVYMFTASGSITY